MLSKIIPLLHVQFTIARTIVYVRYGASLLVFIFMQRLAATTRIRDYTERGRPVRIGSSHKSWCHDLPLTEQTPDFRDHHYVRDRYRMLVSAPISNKAVDADKMSALHITNIGSATGNHPSLLHVQFSKARNRKSLSRWCFTLVNVFDDRSPKK